MESKESKPVSLSTTQGTQVLGQGQPFQPRKLALSSSVMLPGSGSGSGSLPIRAPITVDDDSDFESNDSKFENTSTGNSSLSGGEYEVFVSGEEFESASERAFVVDPDEDTVEEGDFGDKYDLFRPIVAYPDEEILENGVEDEEESGEVEENLKPIRPIAQLSWEDDGSDLVGSEVEDEVSLSRTEVANIGVVVKISVAPRIKIFKVEEEGEDDSMVQAVSLTVNQSENFKFDNFVEAENSFPSTKEEKLHDVLVEETGHGGGEVLEESLVTDNNDVMKQSSESVPDAELYCVENLKFEKYDTERNTDIQDSSDSELLPEESDATQESVGDALVENEELNLLGSNVVKGKAENNLKNAVEELLVCEKSNKRSVDISGGATARLHERTDDEIPERNMDVEIDVGHVKDNSLATTLELTDNRFEGNQNEFDFNKFSVSNQAEDIVDFGKCDILEKVDEYEKIGCDEDTTEEEKPSPVSDEDVKDLVNEISEISKQIMNELGQVFVAASNLGTEGSEDPSQDSDEGDKDSDGKGDFFNSATLMTTLNTTTSVNVPRDTNVSRDLVVDGPNEFEVNLSEEEKKKIEKMRLLRVKFLRLVHRLGISLEDPAVTQVLGRLVLDVGKHTNHLGSLESTKKMALDLEAENKSNLDLCLNILVLGKSGVGKSATINFIFGEKKAIINAFKPATTAVKEIVGTVDGVKIRILDTPGLKVSAVEQVSNQKVLATISKYIKKFPPDVVLYVDRLDTQSKDNDLPLLRSITRSLGSSIWKNAIVALTHSASVPPDGPSGLPLSHDVFVVQKYGLVLQSISIAIGNMYLMNPCFMHPLALVENNPLLSKGSGERSQFLLLCYSIKVLSEASTIPMLHNPSDWRKFLGFPIHSTLLPYLLSSLLHSRAHPNNAESDAEFADLRDPESDDEDEYDQFPSFKPLNRSQIAKLSKQQRKSYFEEYDCRVKLLQRKQWKEEIKRLREIKNKGKDGTNIYHDLEGRDQEEMNPTSVSVPLPDMAFSPCFDGEDSAYRYRSLEPSSQLLVRPVMGTYCWDHDFRYNGVNLERDFVVSDQLPASISVQITKDKKKFNIQLDSSVSMKHVENCSTLAGLDIQTVGTQLAYILGGETKVRNLRINKTTAGLNVTFVGENLVTGFKIEDQIAIGKCLVLAASAGAVKSRGYTAYGANLELRLKKNDFPIGQDQSNFGLSLMKWKGDLALTASLQSQFTIGRSSKVALQIGLNRKRSGQITIRTTSSDQLHIALVGILPILVSICRSIYTGLSAQNSTY